MAHPYIAQLTHDLGLTEEVSPTDNKGEFFFRFGPQLAVVIRPFAKGFHFIANIAPTPLKHCEEIFLTLLHANLFGLGTGGNVIGMEEEGKWLTFSLALPGQINYSQFKEELELFVNYLELWQGKVATLTQNS